MRQLPVFFCPIPSCMESLDSLNFCWVEKVLVRERSEPVQMCEVDVFLCVVFCFQRVASNLIGIPEKTISKNVITNDK